MNITAAGSLPGDDFRGALTAMAEALPELMPWPELPARGVESGMIGRALGLTQDLAFDLTTAGWRLTQHSDRQHRRAVAQWRQDLDDAEELLQEFEGRIKIALAGPWTLATAVERPTGDKVLGDAGARREVSQAVAEGARQLGEELTCRLPNVELVWQTDEPSMPAVREGQIKTASGLHRHRSVDVAQLVDLMPNGDILHCCAPGEWIDIAARAGHRCVYVDARFADIDSIGAWLDGGRDIILGAIDASTCTGQSTDAIIDTARRVTREVGTERVWLAPSCGLAGWNRQDISWQLTQLRQAADLLVEG